MMNKKINFKLLLLLVATLTVITSCVEDDDYNAPNFTETPPNVDQEDVISINAMKGILDQESENGLPYTFSDETDSYIEGYVISSDEGGNFYKELIIQDAPENPTIGVKVLVDVNPLFTRFNVGRKVYVKLEGLTVGFANGDLSLGLIQNGSEAESIPEAFLDEYVLRTTEVAEIVPTQLDIADLSNDLLLTYVEFQNTQFSREYFTNGVSEVTYAAESSDNFDGFRTIVSCESEAELTLSTSTFADFKGLTIAQGSGSISGILTRDFDNAFTTLYLNTPEDVVMTGERCDPELFNCEGPISSSDEIFNEDFEGINNISQLPGWVNVNVVGGDTDYFIGNFNNNNYAQVSGFNSEESEIEAWLITPEMNLDVSTQEQFTARIEAAYDNGKSLKVFITQSYTGDPTTTEWEELDVNVPTGPGNSFGGLQNVGPVNISCVEGQAVRIGFRYRGSDPSSTTRYHIDDVTVSGLLD